jgi:hypothetical protein
MMTKNGLGYILGDSFANSSGHPESGVGPGLPDFSWHNIAKWGNYTK